MTTQTILGGVYPVYVNETVSTQSIVGDTYLSQTQSSGTTYNQALTATSLAIATLTESLIYGRTLSAACAGVASFQRQLNSIITTTCASVADIRLSYVKIVLGTSAASAAFQKQINKLLIAR